MNPTGVNQNAMQRTKTVFLGISLVSILIGCETDPHKKKPPVHSPEPSQNAKPIQSEVVLGMSTNAAVAILGKPFFTTPLKEGIEIWAWPTPTGHAFDNRFLIFSEGKVVFIPRKPDSTPAEEMDAAWAIMNQKPVGIISPTQADWAARTAGIQAGDSREVVKHKLGIDKWWDEYANVYAAAVAPNLEIFVVVFENDKEVLTKSLPYNDYFAFTKIERDRADDKVRTDYVVSHPDESQAIKDAILQKRLCVGMNPEQVELSWGHPEKKKIGSGPSTRAEEWIYPDRTYLYFTDGTLLSWQKTE